MIFCEKFLQKIKISLRRDVEKLISRKRYFCLFVCLCVFISAIKLPRIPTYYLKDGEIDEAVNLVTSNYDFVKEKAYDILECIKKNGNKINVSNYDAFLTKFKELKFIS